MPTIVNRLLLGFGLIGSLVISIALLAHVQQEHTQFVYWLTLFAAVVSVMASSFALTSVDHTGITHEGRVTSIVPLVLAACGLALTARWAPERLPLAIFWFVFHIPGTVIGLSLPTSNLLETLRNKQAKEDRRIAIQWELKQITNRVQLLHQLTRPGGPDPSAQKKLVTTGNSLEKYYTDTKKQIEVFLEQADDEAQRSSAQQMLQELQQMKGLIKGSSDEKID